MQGKGNGEQEGAEIGNGLTALHAEQSERRRQDNHRRDIEQALTGNGQDCRNRFIADRLAGDADHKVDGKQRHTNTLQPP